jgi:hypothetical protein
MSDPVPVSGYGPATWADFTHNWRKADTDFLQARSIMRYQTTAARNAIPSPQPGMVVYNAELDRLELRKTAAGGSWAGLYTIDGLVIEPVGATTDIKLRNPTTAGNNGLVFTTTQIATQVPIVTAGNELKFEATGLTIATGTKAAKLTTNALELVSDTRFTAPQVWLTAATPTLGLSVAGTSTFVGAITAAAATFSGLVTANANVSAPNAPTTTSHLTNKAYVDAGDAARLSLSGGTMNNYILIHQDNSAAGGLCLRLRDVSNKPYIDWMDWAGNQLGWIQGTTANLTMYAKGDILLNSAGGQVRTSDAIYTTGGNSRFFSQATNLCGWANSCHLDFYGAGSHVDNVGSRYGYIGYAGSGHLRLRNEVNDCSMFLDTQFALVFGVGQSYAEVARFESSGLVIGKTVFNTGTEGHALFTNGTHYSTVSASGAANMYINRIGGTAGDRWVYFGRSGSWIGSIYQVGTTGTGYATSCDYRMKTIVGPILNACDRLMALKPWRVTWNDDPERGETDDFMAHEVAEIVPDAVNGVKDAVDDNGKPVYQHLAESKLITLTIAALQDVIGRVDAIERNIAPVLAA